MPQKSGALCEKHIGIWRIYAVIQSFKRISGKINVNQHEMGQLVGVSRQTISQIERGITAVGDVGAQDCKVFEVPVEAYLPMRKNRRKRNSRQGGEVYDRRDREMQPED